MLDLDLLRSYLAVIETGSMTAAADMVGRTQAAISMQMKRLEDRVGQPLLIRTGRAMQPSEAGKRLIPHARRMLLYSEQALADLACQTEERSLILGLPDDYASSYLDTVLTGLSIAFPQLQVEVICDESLDLIGMIRDGSIDLAIVTAGHGGADTRVLRQEPIIWAIGDDHVTAERRPLPLAVFHEGCVLRKRCMDLLDRAGIAWRIAYVSPSVAGIQAAVRAGLAVSAIAERSLVPGIRAATAADNLPTLGSERICLEMRSGDDPLLAAIAAHIENRLKAL